MVNKQTNFEETDNQLKITKKGREFIRLKQKSEDKTEEKKKIEKEIVYEYLSWEKFEHAINELIKQIKPYIQNDTSERTKIKTIYGIPRGGLIPAVVLSHKLNIPLITEKKEIDEHTLIVDDISDSGETLKKYPNNMSATIFFHKETKTWPNFTVFEKTDKWIVYPWENEAEIIKKQENKKEQKVYPMTF